MHPFLYPLYAVTGGKHSPQPEGGNTQIFQKVSRKGGRHPYQSLKAAMKLLIFLRF